MLVFCPPEADRQNTSIEQVPKKEIFHYPHTRIAFFGRLCKVVDEI